MAYGGFWRNLRKATTFRTRTRRVGLEPPEYDVVASRRRSRETTPAWSLYAAALLQLAFGAFVMWNVQYGVDQRIPHGISLLLVVVIGVVVAVRNWTALTPDRFHRVASTLIALLLVPVALLWLLG